VTRSKTALLLLLLASVCCAGCGTRVVIVKPGDPVRLREPLRNVKVWAYDGKGQLVPGVADEIGAGWWCIDTMEAMAPAK